MLFQAREPRSCEAVRLRRYIADALPSVYRRMKRRLEKRNGFGALKIPLAFIARVLIELALEFDHDFDSLCSIALHALLPMSGLCISRGDLVEEKTGWS